VGSRKHKNEPSNSTKGRTLLDQLNDYQLAKDSLQWSDFLKIKE
jgi:hypothetical protein